MTDEQQAGAAGEQTRQIIVHKVYIKDCSLESPNTPAVFGNQWEPQVNLNLTTANKQIDEQNYEVTLSVTAEAKLQDNVAFLCEIHQAGLFKLTGFDDDERRRLLGAYCPNLLFPYAREAVSDLVGKAGFPHLLLQPVNFDGLYEKHAQELARAGGEAVQQADKH